MFHIFQKYNVHVRVLQEVTSRLLTAGILLITLSATVPTDAQTEGYGLANESDPILTQARYLLKSGKGTHAKAIYEAYLNTHPESATALLGLAHIAHRNFDFPTARVHLENALASNPENIDVMAHIGRLYHQWSANPFGPQENYNARADEHFTQAEALDAAHPLLLAYRADWLLDQGDLVSAERYFQRSLRLNPRCIEAYQGLTRYYIRVKDLKRAKDTALHAIELDPNNSLSHFQVGKLLGQAEHPEKAVKYALKSEALDFGRNPERNLFLAQQFEKLGNTAQAIEYYMEVTKDAPNHTTATVRLAELYEQRGEGEKSVQFYRKAIANDSRILTRMIQDAHGNLRQENTAAAVRLYLKAIAIDPRLTPEALHGMATALLLDSHYQRPNTAMQNQVLKLLNAQQNPDAQMKMSHLKALIAKSGFATPALRGELQIVSETGDDLAAGEALFLLGQYADSKNRLDRVDGQTAEGYLAVADRLLGMQALDSARVMYQRGFQIDGLPALRQGLERVEAKRDLADQRIEEGNSLFAEERFSDALRPYGDAKMIFPSWDVPYLRLADTYEQLDRKVSAYYAYKQALEINPSLLDSEGFAKKYRKLEKKTRKIEAKQAKQRP